ncbi:response regulator transcription factor [Halomonas binhaiensis]|uniref:Response regulator transcription factor n=1 Tax=Halomonas binhaiensis TaxID=2562282 RepID=A0A5C1NE22_9GAMM|nr:response regulator transcription factor [Halomonas binhaiensis]QEM80327.1 response regulator transcription factor [Halomonas binhaiensis]
MRSIRKIGNNAGFGREENKATAIIVDDHPVARFLVKHVLTEAGVEVVSEASNGEDAIRLVEYIQPDMVILDLKLPDMDGLTATVKLREQENPPVIFIMTAQSVEAYGKRCREAGASGFISKEQDVAVFVEGIKAILRGYTFFPQNMERAWGHTNSGEESLGKLSVREKMVMDYIIRGMKNKDISELLSLSPKSISTYKTRVFKKLKVNNVIELADAARRYSLLEDNE